MSSEPIFPAIDGGAGMPPEPDWTKIFKLQGDRESAHELWHNVTSEMATSSTLALVNGSAVLRYVMFQVEFQRQARAIGKGGVVRAAKKTKVPAIHPAWSVMKQAAEAAAMLEGELAISPRRRNNGGKINRAQQRKQRAADAFLKPVS